MYESAIAWYSFWLGERKRREPTRGGAPKGKNYPADTTETLPLQDFYFSSDYFAP
jgi:hypothetical protein